MKTYKQLLEKLSAKDLLQRALNLKKSSEPYNPSALKATISFKKLSKYKIKNIKEIQKELEKLEDKQMYYEYDKLQYTIPKTRLMIEADLDIFHDQITITRNGKSIIIHDRFYNQMYFIDDDGSFSINNMDMISQQALKRLNYELSKYGYNLSGEEIENKSDMIYQLISRLTGRSIKELYIESDRSKGRNLFIKDVQTNEPILMIDLRNGDIIHFIR